MELEAIHDFFIDYDCGPQLLVSDDDVVPMFAGE